MLPENTGQDRILTALDRAALVAVLLLPLFLLHARAFGEASIAISGLCFLARSARLGDWAWTRTPWLIAGWAWWGWEVICSLPIPGLNLGEGGTNSLIQALAVVRYIIFLAALEHAILAPVMARTQMWWVIAASTAYIAVHSLAQFATGYNLYGIKPGLGGELTGPFDRPRAGSVYARLLLPAVIPWVAARTTHRLMTWGLLLIGVATAVLIGQRMPLLLLGLGLVIVAVLLPRLRWGVAAAGIAIAVVLAASPVIAPQAHQRLVVHFTNQMAHFPTSHYGLLYARAIEVGVRNPITGMGAEGFRTGCEKPAYFRPSFDGSIGEGGGREICWHHPHQYYLEALTIGGFPGLFLFCALVILWLRALGRGLWRSADPLRAALFAATAINLWPIASATGFTTMPVSGWCFLLLGWGLAEARAATSLADPARAPI